MDHVLGYLKPLLDALGSELDDIGIDRIEVFEKVSEEAQRRLAKSIQAGRRRAEGKQAASQLAEAELVGA